MMARLVDIECIVKHKTDRAVLIDDGDTEAWLPLAHAEVETRGRHALVTIPEWLAQEKGLI
ncbi:hypothetical protein [uncultured Paraglaciecola sp.]|uniref:hypothetical protein n=1 Tax=uncultured Paraglaciecola sp. TaxID=1765024 RepID=UPI002611D086|nr:hypothetical protein [uncultured Paraglaciecola sp.]